MWLALVRFLAWTLEIRNFKFGSCFLVLLPIGLSLWPNGILGTYFLHEKAGLFCSRGLPLRSGKATVFLQNDRVFTSCSVIVFRRFGEACSFRLQVIRADVEMSGRRNCGVTTLLIYKRPYEPNWHYEAGGIKFFGNVRITLNYGLRTQKSI